MAPVWLFIDSSVSEDDAIAHFWFRKRHLQEVADKIWPRVQEYLVGGKMAVTYNSGNFSTHLVSGGQ